MASLESLEYLTWRDTAWQRCLAQDATTTHVAVWTDAGYQCYRAPPKCSLTGHRNVQTWTL